MIRSRLSSLVAVALGLLAMAASPSVQAGTIILSGDVNIVDALPGGAAAANAGNSTFFSNVLGGGNSVLIHGTGAGRNTTLNAYYNSVAGVTSSLLGGAITGAGLAGVDLFVSMLPSAAYAASEITALSGYLSGGGTVLFIGDNNFFPSENGLINGALSALGSGMSLQDTYFDAGYQIATGAQIAANALTAGIASFTYAAPSQVTVAGGNALFFGTGGQPFVAVEGQNQVPDSGSSLLLLGLGVGFLGWFSRRMKLTA